MMKTRDFSPSERRSPPLSRRAQLVAAIFAFLLAAVCLVALASVVRAEGVAPPAAAADDRPMMVVATRILRAGTVVGPDDVALLPAPTQTAAGATIPSLEAAIGLETRVSVYDGRPIRPGELGPQTLIQRNDIVTLRFAAGGLAIQTDGRALDAGGLGEKIRVMNLDSRRTVTGAVAGPQLVVMQ